MKLYTYFRSSASYRVRIALNLKGLQADLAPVNLLKGEQGQDTYTAINPQGLVPSLVDGPHVLSQSLAIMEYLDEAYPGYALLPKAPAARAQVRAIAQAIACEIAPINNLKVLRYLTGTLGASEEQKNTWYKHWVAQGLGAVEKLLAPTAGLYCHGDTPGLADCCLVPQVFNAKRFGCDLEPYPIIRRLAEECEKHPAFVAAHPDNQPDAA